MKDVLGLIGLAVFIVVIIAAAAGISWVVVKFSPTKN
jgi:hypothetical protein